MISSGRKGVGRALTVRGKDIDNLGFCTIDDQAAIRWYLDIKFFTGNTICNSQLPSIQFKKKTHGQGESYSKYRAIRPCLAFPLQLRLLPQESFQWLLLRNHSLDI